VKVLDIAAVIVIALVALGLALFVRVVKLYQLGVSFRLGRALGPRMPGPHRIVQVVDALPVGRQIDAGRGAEPAGPAPAYGYRSTAAS
jgi:regulator of protease activity HflC (stomatin/prohibitin superfamily)